MAAKLDVRELPDRLEYRVTEQKSRTHLLLRASAWIAAFIFPASMMLSSPVFAVVMTGILLYSSASDIRRARRGTDVSFIVTERDIVSSGYTQLEYYPFNRWRIQAPDLSWKEGHTSSEDGPTFPHGVYCGNDCALPLVTMEDGHRIITRIYSRYPDTSSENRYDRSSVPSPIITLGLSKR